MSPADPPHSADRPAGAPERDPHEGGESELGEEASGADANDLDALRMQEDVPGLLALAKACRAGTAQGGRDMARCLDAYRAAAALGSAEAEYAVALFYLNGGAAIAQDLKEGTTRLRSAAEKGSVPAKVYLGNLYELGIHYKADAEKADVWYRNAGRGARIEADPSSDDWSRELAELGCARYVLLLTRDPAMDEEEKKGLLARAKAHGYGLRIRHDAAEGDRASIAHALAGAEAATAAPPEPRQRKDTSPETAQAKRRAEEARAKIDPRAADDRYARLTGALAAFGYALLFALAGAGAGYAATLGAQELVAHGHVLPLVGTRIRLVFPIVLGVVGILPSWLVYKLGAVVKALLLGAVVAGLGWVAWGTGQGAFHGDRPLQALAFGLAGFLAGLLVLGLIGGAKTRRAVARQR